MNESQPYDPVEDGIQQIEEFIRDGDLGNAQVAFELLSGGLALSASQLQIDRMRGLARTLGADFRVGQECPEWSAEEVSPAGFQQR